ncbi:MAG: hypothetical protein HC818_00075 [Synechococcaceae cyanobacterium RM1_1_27]|nr:hypothetical protein [Synechococcaceae cyanobacterium RM1_1_27]
MPDEQKPRKPEADQKSGLPENQVNLSIKVPESLRRHWVAEAKRSGTTITAVVIEALKERFGEPIVPDNS